MDGAFRLCQEQRSKAGLGLAPQDGEEGGGEGAQHGRLARTIIGRSERGESDLGIQEAGVLLQSASVSLGRGCVINLVCFWCFTGSRDSRNTFKESNIDCLNDLSSYAELNH